MNDLKDIIKKLLSFLFTNWNGWKITLYICIFLYCSMAIWFDTRVVIVKDHYVKMEDYYVSAVDVTNGENLSYKIKDNALFLIFDSADIFNEINDGKIYFVRSQGFRIPIFSMFPKILKLEEIDIKYTEVKS